MREITLFIGLTILSSISWAAGPVNCEALKAAETQTYERLKKDVDKNVGPVAQKMRDFLATITPGERAIIQEQSSASVRLTQLAHRVHVELNAYGADSNPCPKDYTYKGKGECLKYVARKQQTIRLSSGTFKTFVSSLQYGKMVIEIRHDVIYEHRVDEFTLMVDITNAKNEEASINEQVAEYYPAPTLALYLKGTIPAVCQK